MSVIVNITLSTSHWNHNILLIAFGR